MSDGRVPCGCSPDPAGYCTRIVLRWAHPTRAVSARHRDGREGPLHEVASSRRAGSLRPADFDGMSCRRASQAACSVPAQAALPRYAALVSRTHRPTRSLSGGPGGPRRRSGRHYGILMTRRFRTVDHGPDVRSLGLPSTRANARLHAIRIRTHVCQNQ